MNSEKVKSRTLSHSGFLSFVSEKELSENRGFSFISTFYRYFFLSFMLLIKITRCTTTAANIKIVPQTLIIKGTSVNNSKTFISVQKNQQIEAINHKTLTFFIIITDLYVYYSIKAAINQCEALYIINSWGNCISSKRSFVYHQADRFLIHT